MIGWGIDLGVGSIGFAVLRRDGTGSPSALIDGVSRIFPASAGAAERRRYKAVRKGGERRSKRLRTLEATLRQILGDPNLTASGCADQPFVAPNTKHISTTDRVHLRAIGLEGSLSAGDLFKAVLHIAKNRGQRLSRGLKEAEDDKSAESDRKETADKARATAASLMQLGLALGQEGPATPGQLLYERLKQGKPTRLVKHRDDTPVFTRIQVTDELDRLLTAQARFHPALHDEAVRAAIMDAAFWEKEPPEPTVGKCLYGIKDTNGVVEDRLPAATELFQCKRIYEEVNNLRLRDRRTGKSEALSQEMRDAVVALPLAGQKLTVSRLRKVLGLGRDALAPLTSLEEQKGRGGAKGRGTAGEIAAHPLAEAMAKAGYGDYWQGLDNEAREELFFQLANEDDAEVLQDWLSTRHGLDTEAARILIALRLPSRRTAAGPTATALLLEELKNGVVSVFEAEQAARLKRTDPLVRLRLERLPYYGELFPEDCVGGSRQGHHPPEERHGRIPNPVVHLALNQLRHLANRYAKLYGPPQWINLELARDLNKSADEREEIERKNRANRKQNDEWAATIRGQGKRVNRRNLMKMRLYSWQRGLCLYTGRPIGMNELFTSAVEIDHILPRAETQDDGVANLALVRYEANQFKGKRTPYEAFHLGYDGQDYPTLLKRVEETRKGSLWRFAEGALQSYRERGDMQARYLNDTRYIAKLASAYLAHLLPDRERIVTVTGAMTAQLRHLWGLDDIVAELMVEDGRLDRAVLMSTRLSTDEERAERATTRRKLRFDHRHHLLDAIVVGCCTRSDVHRLQTLSARVGGYEDLKAHLAAVREEGDSLFRETGLPWSPGFRAEVKRFLADAADTEPEPARVSRVSHKPDHNPLGQLHAQTYYRVICALSDGSGRYLCGSHQSLTSLNSRKQIEAIGIADQHIADLRQAVDEGKLVAWGQPAPVIAMENLKRQQEDLRAALLNRLEQAPPSLAKEDEQVAWATAKHTECTGERRYLRVETRSLRILKGPVNDAALPRNAVATAGNDRLVHWLDRDAQGHWDVVATIDAARPGYREPWEDCGGKLIFRLRKNDIVEMAVDPRDPSRGRALYRLASLSPGDFEFVPVEEARSAMEGRSIYTVRLKSRPALNDRLIRHVVLTPDGRRRWRSAGRN